MLHIASIIVFWQVLKIAFQQDKEFTTISGLLKNLTTSWSIFNDVITNLHRHQPEPESNQPSLWLDFMTSTDNNQACAWIKTSSRLEKWMKQLVTFYSYHSIRHIVIALGIVFSMDNWTKTDLCSGNDEKPVEHLFPQPNETENRICWIEMFTFFLVQT